MSSANDDLTTDAVPSPSHRATSKKNNVKDEDLSDDYSNIHEETEDIEETFSSEDQFTNLKQNSGPMPIPNRATTTVININNGNNIHVGNINTYNVIPRSESSKKNIRETRAIKSLKACDRQLERDDLLFVSEHIDETWRDIARHLHYSEGQIKQFYIDNHKLGIKEVIFQFLLDWIQMQPSNATVGHFCQILWEKDQKEVVELWSKKKGEKCIKP